VLADCLEEGGRAADAEAVRGIVAADFLAPAGGRDDPDAVATYLLGAPDAGRFIVAVTRRDGPPGAPRFDVELITEAGPLWMDGMAAADWDGLPGLIALARWRACCHALGSSPLALLAACSEAFSP